MNEVLTTLLAEWQAGRTAALATVVRTVDSAPRPPGAQMLVTASGVVVGSVSGGCVEGAVYEQAMECLGGAGPTLARYGVSDDDAFAAGLTCGGIIEVFIEALPPGEAAVLGPALQGISNGEPVGIATVIEHPDPSRLGRKLAVLPSQTPAQIRGSLGSVRADQAAADDALGLLAAGRSAALTYGQEGERLDSGMRVFLNAFAPLPRMLVFACLRAHRLQVHICVASHPAGDTRHSPVRSEGCGVAVDGGSGLRAPRAVEPCGISGARGRMRSRDGQSAGSRSSKSGHVAAAKGCPARSCRRGLTEHGVVHPRFPAVLFDAEHRGGG